MFNWTFSDQNRLTRNVLTGTVLKGTVWTEIVLIGTANVGTVLSVAAITLIVLTVTAGALLLKELLRILFCRQNLDLDTWYFRPIQKLFFKRNLLCNAVS